jgi:hypothetical protein
MGFAAAVVVINAPPSKSEAKEIAESFAFKLNEVSDAALFEGRYFRVAGDEETLMIEEYRDEAWTKILALADFGGRRDVEVTFEINDPVRENARILGESDPLEDGAFRFAVDPMNPAGELTVRFQRRSEIWRVSLLNTGEVELERDAAR